MKTTFFVLLALFTLIQLVARLAPTVPARWHVDPFAARDPGPAGLKRIMPVPMTPEEALARLSDVAETEPRTRYVAGSVEEGRLTYRTRTAFWGFPDFTTVAARASDNGAQVAFYARLRFGKSDLGVNQKRVESWIDQARF